MTACRCCPSCISPLRMPGASPSINSGGQMSYTGRSLFRSMALLGALSAAVASSADQGRAPTGADLAPDQYYLVLAGPDSCVFMRDSTPWARGVEEVGAGRQRRRRHPRPAVEGARTGPAGGPRRIPRQHLGRQHQADFPLCRSRGHRRRGMAVPEPPRHARGEGPLRSRARPSSTSTSCRSPTTRVIRRPQRHWESSTGRYR